jgi:O-antigen/teichoic acid export membrane protein
MLERRQFLGDWAANFLSLGALAASGILINTLIAKHHGAAALGIFNQVFSIYVLGSQLATLGVQFSVLRYVAEDTHDRGTIADIVTSALSVAAVSAFLVAIPIGLIFAFFGGRIYSQTVANGVMVMLPGLWFFALNKVLLNTLNALRLNRLYAALTTFRYLLMAGTITLAIAAGAHDYMLSIILPASEAILLVTLALTIQRVVPGVFSYPRESWIRRHLAFGLRSVPGGLAVGLNTRIDVLVLGLFTTDAAVGVYSFAAFFIEGLLQLPQLSRRIVDPPLARLSKPESRADLSAFVKKGRNLGAAGALLVAALAIAVYPVIATLLVGPALSSQSWSVFAILMMGAGIFGIYATFGGLLSQAGLPAAQSRLNVTILAANLLLNFALVPAYGINGAAIATALSFIIGTVYFRMQVNRLLGIQF